MSNHELDSIIGQAGISMAVSHVEIFEFIDNFRYCASDDGYIQFSGIKVHDGSGGTAKYNWGTGTPDDYFTGYPATNTGMIHLDIGAPEVATLDDWDPDTDPGVELKGMIGIYNEPAWGDLWQQELAYAIDDIELHAPDINGNNWQTVSLGEMALGPIDIPSFKYYLAPHDESGIDFEHDFQMHIDRVEYFYQCVPDNCKSLAFNNIHFGNSFNFGSAGDDPADPATWTTEIGDFKIGNIFGNTGNRLFKTDNSGNLVLNNDPIEHSRPAQFDVGTADFGNGAMEGAVRLALPMTGSIRFENADFGGTDFGPGAIDGINAYRLNVYLIP